MKAPEAPEKLFRVTRLLFSQVGARARCRDDIAKLQSRTAPKSARQSCGHWARRRPKARSWYRIVSTTRRGWWWLRNLGREKQSFFHPVTIPRAREDKARHSTRIFSTVVFYGVKILRRKTAQFCATQRVFGTRSRHARGQWSAPEKVTDYPCNNQISCSTS
jgi:hypothetical protein